MSPEYLAKPYDHDRGSRFWSELKSEYHIIALAGISWTQYKLEYQIIV